MTHQQQVPSVFLYAELADARLEHAMEAAGEVHVVLDRRRADIFAALIELQRRHDRPHEDRSPPSVRLLAAVEALCFILRLSLFHRRLFEAQRLAFEFSSRHDRIDRSPQEVLFRFFR